MIKYLAAYEIGPEETDTDRLTLTQAKRMATTPPADLIYIERQVWEDDGPDILQSTFLYERNGGQ